MSKRVYCTSPSDDVDGSHISSPSTKTIRVDESVVRQSEDKCIQVDDIFYNDDEQIDYVAGEVTNLLVRQVSELADRFQLAPNPHSGASSSCQTDGPSEITSRRRGCLKKTAPREKRKVLFNTVTVLYFERSQGFTCVPSIGGSTLGMHRNHHSQKTFTLETHAEERKRAHREILIRRKKFEKTQRENFSETESESDNNSEFSDIDLENDSVYFLQPVSVKERRALLRASGVTKIDPSEKEECREIRISREYCGCDCETYCNPKTCACSLAGIQCQVDRLSFPCGCVKDQCNNHNGRIEFNPMRVKTHFVNTILRLNRANKEQCALLRGDTVDGVCESGQLSYHSMVHPSAMHDNHQQAMQYMQQTSAQHQLPNGSQYGVADPSLLDAGYGAQSSMFATATGYSPSTSTYSDESEYTNSSDFEAADPDNSTVQQQQQQQQQQQNGNKSHCSPTGMVMNNGMFHQNGYPGQATGSTLPSFTTINGHSYPNHSHMQSQFYGQYSNGHPAQQSPSTTAGHTESAASLYYANHYAFQADKCEPYGTMGAMNAHIAQSGGQDSRTLTGDSFMSVHVGNGTSDHLQQSQQQYTDLSVHSQHKKAYSEQAFLQQNGSAPDMCYGSVDTTGRSNNGCGQYQAYSQAMTHQQVALSSSQCQAQAAPQQQQPHPQQHQTANTHPSIHANDSYVPNSSDSARHSQYAQSNKQPVVDSRHAHSQPPPPVTDTNNHRSSTEAIVESVSA